MHVAVLAGGLSLERDVSLRSGRRVVDALVDRGVAAHMVDLDPGLLEQLTDVEVVFLTLHGRTGEDGAIQGILDVLGVPYTGPGAVASALAWDKNVAKGVLARAGVDTPDWVAVSADAVRQIGGRALQARIIDRIGLPLVVKPVEGGAFMGVRFVREAAGLADALLAAFSYGDAVLVERFVDGTEIAVSVLDGTPLPPVEIVPKAGTYDFEARYTHGATDFYVPARLDSDVTAAAQQVALVAWDVVGCRQLSRVDMIVDDDGVPWLLELDTCPGLTETSLLPMALSAAALDFGEVCERLAEDAAAVR